MNLLSLANIRRPVLFEIALRNADAAQLQALREESASLDPRRRQLLETELSRRKTEESISWLPPVLMLLMLCGMALVF